jgi:RNase P subunit RPR2
MLALRDIKIMLEENMDKKMKNLKHSIMSDNENIKKEIISKMNYCEKCKKPLFEEIFFWDSSRKQFMKTNRVIACVSCNKA